MHTEKRSLLSSFLMAILTISVISTIQTLNQGTLLPVAAADQEIEIRTLLEADRKIVYLTAERAESIQIKVRNGTAIIAHEGLDYLPQGISITPKSATADQYVIHIGKKIKVSAEQLPVTYGLDFYDPVQSTEAARILLVIDGIDASSRSAPSLQFDKQTYSRGELATLVAKDPHIDCIVPDMLPDGKLLGVQLTFNDNPMSPLNLPRDINSNNEFRSSFIVPDGTGRLEASYKPASSCVYPAESSTPSALANIVDAKISFDMDNYAYQDTATLTVIDGTGEAKPIEIRATKIVDGSEVPVDVDSDFRSVIPDTGPISNTFTKTVRLDEVLAPDIFADGAFSTITATYGDVDGAQDVATILPERKTSVIIPEGRSSFFTNDTASFEMLYPQWNTNPLAFDRNYLTLCTYSTDSGNKIDGGRTVITLAETGYNTGIFVNSYHMAFINPDFDITLIPPADRELFANSTLKVLPTSSSTLVSKMGNVLECPASIPPESPLERVVIVQPSVKSDPDEEGRGQNIGAVAHTDPPLFSVSQVSCNQYNYGPDEDGDGICDNWETTSGLKVYYPAGGNSWTLSYTNDPAPKPNHVDIFVEMDYVNNVNIAGCNDGRSSNIGNNYKPNTAAMNNVEAAFRGAPVYNPGAYGVELHIYIDDAVNSGVCWESVSIWGEDAANPGVITFDEIKKAQFGKDDSERMTTNKGKAKFQVFHYGLSIPRQVQDMASSGVAEQLGNDFVVSLGASGIGWSDANMGGTIMHELGHNLGLYHGGPDVAGNDYNVNCKPNYPSVMTYVRQLTNAYSNTTLKYSDDILSPSAISRVSPNEENVLKLTASSWMSLIELVWGIDPGSSGGPITILSGDSTETPSVSGDVYKTLSDVDWDGDGSIASGSIPGGNIANLGISGCSGADTDNMISGADDWDNLQYNFRSLNPDAFETGFGDRQYFPLEINTTIVTEIRAKAVNTTDLLISSISDAAFEEDNSCSDSGFDFADGTSFDIEEIITLILTDAGSNIESNTEDELKVKITSSSDLVGFDLILEETGTSTGVFEEEFLITASMNTTGEEITVQDGDKVILEYTDMCSVGPTEIGSDFRVTFIVGGTDADVVVEEIRTVPDKVSSEFHNKLVNGSRLDTQVYLQSSISNATLLELVERHDLETAERELLAMRKYIDGSAGGNKTDDLLKEEGEAIRARQFLDNLLASFIEANLTDSNRKSFNVTSHDFDCTTDTQTFEPCRISGHSDSLTSTADTFKVEPSKKRLSLDLAGQGDVTLEIPTQLTLNGTLSHVRSYVHGGSYHFNKISSNGSGSTFLIEDLSLHPRYIALFYGPELVSATPITVMNSSGMPVTTLFVGEQAELSTILTNYGGWTQNFAAFIEVRDSSGVTTFLGYQNGNITADGLGPMSQSWKPEERGAYTLRVFVIDDFISPEVLSLVREITIEVKEKPIVSTRFKSYEIGDAITVTVVDSGANVDPSSIDDISAQVLSNLTNDVKSFTASELTPDSGVFRFDFVTSTNATGLQIQVMEGDVVTIKYLAEGREYIRMVRIQQDMLPLSDALNQ